MSYIQITFTGASEAADTLLSDLVTKDVFPTINSGVSAISQYIVENGSLRYEVTFQTPDDNALRANLISYIEKHYPSVVIDVIMSVVAPVQEEYFGPSVTEVQPGEGSNQ